MNNNEKLIKFITIIIVGLLIILPFFQEKLSIFKITPIQENRNKQKRPESIKDILLNHSTFTTQYEKYFNDTYGFRDCFIKFKNQIDYSLFNLSREVIIGKDNWLFYRNVVENEEINIEKFSQENYNKFFQQILKLNSYLRSKNIILIIIPLPMKNTIYPEMMPSSTAHRPVETGFQKYRNFLKSHPEIISIDAQAILMDLKMKMPVYHKTDFHWNDVAGFHIATELVNLIGKLSNKKIRWNYPLIIKEDKNSSGGQNNSLAVFSPYLETALFVDNKDIKVIGEFKYSDNGLHWEYKTKMINRDDLLPKTVMFADSYSDAFIRCGFQNYFSELYKFFIYNVGKQYMNVLNDTKFVIIEHIEVVLQSMLSDKFWEEKERK